MLRFVFVFCAVSYFLIHTARANESMYYGTHQQYISTRYAGMGNAGIAMANDTSTLFYNPAGIPSLDDKEINMYIRMGANPDILDFKKDIDHAGKDAQAIANTIKAHYGDEYSFRGPSLGFLWARPDWSFGIIATDPSVDISLHEALGPAVHLYSIQDTTFAFAKGWNIHNIEFGRLDVGITAKAIYRAQIDKIVDIASIQADNSIDDKVAKEGMTADADIGVLWHAPMMDGTWGFLRPSLGLVVRNILDQGYFTDLKLISKTDNGDPEKLHRMVDIGSAFNMPKFSVFTPKFAFDVRDIFNPNWTLNKGVHAGLEFNWEMTKNWKGGWRVGMDQMYWTAGFSGQLGWFRLDLASYGQEVGTASHKVEDRVYMFTTSLDF